MKELPSDASLAKAKDERTARLMVCLLVLSSVYEMDEKTAVMTDCLSAESSVEKMDEMKALRHHAG